MTSEFTPEAYWHIYHDVLLEWTTEPIEHRIEYIQTEKPEHERALRLRLLRPVRGSLPASVVEARRAVVEAWRAYGEARRAYAATLSAHADEINALHAQECEPDCSWDGQTIFPEGAA